MDLSQVVETMSESLYQRLKYAVETGKWPEGQTVDPAQRESALQLTMAYQAKKLESDEIMTINKAGEIVNKPKAELKKQFKQDPSTIATFNNL